MREVKEYSSMLDFSYKEQNILKSQRDKREDNEEVKEEEKQNPDNSIYQ